MLHPRSIHILLALLLPIGLLTGCGEAPPEEPIRPVLAIKVGDVEGFQKDRFPGRAKAKEETNLSFRVFGPLISRAVDVGDEMKAGDLIAQIDPTDYEVALENMRGRLDKAKADLKFGEAEYARTLKTFQDDPGAVSKTFVDKRKQEMDASRAEVRTLTASVEQAKLALSYTTLKAPFDGTIVATYVENFEFVKAQQPIVRLLDKSQIEMVINVPEALIGMAPYVKSMDVIFDPHPDVTLKATISEVGREATETTRTYPVTLVMDQPEEVIILPGMAGVAIGHPELPEAKSGVKIPGHALLSDQSGKQFVWVLKAESDPPADRPQTRVPAVAEKREVSVAEISGRGIIIGTGLTAGEWIATAGLNTLRDGQDVVLQVYQGSEVRQ